MGQVQEAGQQGFKYASSPVTVFSVDPQLTSALATVHRQQYTTTPDNTARLSGQRGQGQERDAGKRAEEGIKQARIKDRDVQRTSEDVAKIQSLQRDRGRGQCVDNRLSGEGAGRLADGCDPVRSE